jgi:hypothetical protein
MIKLLTEKSAESKLSKKVIDYSDLVHCVFPLSVLEKYAEKLEGHWWRVSKYQRLTEDFIRKFADKLNWDFVSQYQVLSDDFMREFQESINWNIISQHKTLSEKFMVDFKDRLVWHKIAKHQYLSEDFIFAFHEKLGWKNISEYQSLSSDFIQEVIDIVDLKLISQSQQLSEDFIYENLSRISDFDVPALIENNKMSLTLIESIIKKIDKFLHEYRAKCMRSIVRNQVVTKEFCFKHHKIMNLNELRNNIVMSKKDIEEIITSVGVMCKLG